MKVPITGTLVGRNGEALPDTELLIRPLKSGTVAYAGKLVASTTQRPRSDANGNFAVDLIPGEYTLSPLIDGPTVLTRFTVTEGGETDLAGYVERLSVEVTPEVVITAQNARREAVEAAEQAAETLTTIEETATAFDTRAAAMNTAADEITAFYTALQSRLVGYVSETDQTVTLIVGDRLVVAEGTDPFPTLSLTLEV